MWHACRRQDAVLVSGSDPAMQWGSAYPSEVIMSSAPSEAWRFLWGGSPYRARSRQPPVPSGALGEEERQPRTNQVKRTQGTLEAGRVTAHPEVWYSLVRACKQTATVVTHRKPLQRHHDGEMPEGLSGSSGPGMQREKREELGRASGLLGTGRPPPTTRRAVDGPGAVESPQSMRRAGKPSTGERG